MASPPDDELPLDEEPSPVVDCESGPDSLPAMGSPTGSAPVRDCESELFPELMPESLLDFCTLPAPLAPGVEGGALEGRLLRVLPLEVCRRATRASICVKSWRARWQRRGLWARAGHRRLTAARRL